MNNSMSIYIILGLDFLDEDILAFSTQKKSLATNSTFTLGKEISLKSCKDLLKYMHPHLRDRFCSRNRTGHTTTEHMRR